MRVVRRLSGIIAVVVVLIPSLARAQAAPVVGVEVSTDESRRGLSWSAGRAAAAADIYVPLGRIEASARIATLRNSPRHFQGDAVGDFSLSSTWAFSGFTVEASATGHLFAGSNRSSDYFELGGELGYTLGPLQLDAGASFAPHQDAIGGNNLYLFAGASAGIPATPFTVSASVGHSSGDADDDVRANRLRPGGSYSDWRLSIDHISGPLTLGIDYVGTDVNEDQLAPPVADSRHSGNRVVARARFAF